MNKELLLDELEKIALKHLSCDEFEVREIKQSDIIHFFVAFYQLKFKTLKEDYELRLHP